MQNNEAKFTERHTMYNLLPLMARTAVVCVVPKAIDVIHDAFFKTNRKVALKSNGKKKPRKKTDTTKLTKQHHDAICAAHIEFIHRKRNSPNGQKLGIPVLIDELNTAFGLEKSATAYSSIYNGHISRESLPELVGELYPTQTNIEETQEN